MLTSVLHVAPSVSSCGLRENHHLMIFIWDPFSYRNYLLVALLDKQQKSTWMRKTMSKFHQWLSLRVGQYLQIACAQSFDRKELKKYSATAVNKRCKYFSHCLIDASLSTCRFELSTSRLRMSARPKSLAPKEKVREDVKIRQYRNESQYVYQCAYIQLIWVIYCKMRFHSWKCDLP